jgi:hypothetical protein
MPDISGSETITIQPNTVKYPVNFILKICTSATANDGNIPFGDTLASAVVKAYDRAGTDVTTSMVTTAASVSGVTVSCKISYFAAAVSGRCKLTVIYTCASGYIDEIDAARVFVENT